MVQLSIGVIEGFFGPMWSSEARYDYASFLSATKNSFYLYAPKRDSHLRRDWKATWDDSYKSFLTSLANEYKNHNVHFGVGLSPLGYDHSPSDQKILQEKLNFLEQIKTPVLGVFFDDMPVLADLAQKQINAVQFIQSHFSGKILFCPSFYSFDPILEKVFGKMPDNYWKDLANGISQNVEVLWTGNKVISQEITSDDLAKAQSIFGRKIFLWDNLYANDGPKRCKIIPLQSYSIRSYNLLQDTAGLALNMMNQGFVSQVTFRSSELRILDGLNADAAFTQALTELSSPELKDFIVANKKNISEIGFDNLSEIQKGELIEQLKNIEDASAAEILSWLQGEYIVGPECLTE